MELEQRVSEDIKEAMKAKEKERLEVLRFAKSLLLKNKTEAKPQPELDVLIAHAKKMKDSMTEFPAGSEAIAKIEAELRYLAPYLPSSMDEAQVRAVIKEIIEQLTASLGQKPVMGAIMKELSPKIKGRFDGKKANDLVKELLG